jgi:hypothetical protein
VQFIEARASAWLPLCLPDTWRIGEESGYCSFLVDDDDLVAVPLIHPTSGDVLIERGADLEGSAVLEEADGTQTVLKRGHSAREANYALVA